MKVAFYKAKGDWINFLIRMRTKGMYSHTELVFSDGVSFSSSERDGGTRFKKVQYKDGHWDFVELDITKHQEKKIREFCKKHDGLFYDWKAIVFAQFFNFYSHKKDEWFCSEICTRALQEIKMIIGTSAHMVDPQEFYELLLEEDKVKNRQWLKIRYLENKEHYFDSYWKVFYTSFAVLTLMFVFSTLVDMQFNLQAFLGSLLGVL